VAYRTLDADLIVQTIQRLGRRIADRFPDSSLASICRELVGVAEHAQQRSSEIARANPALRGAIYVAIAAGAAGLLVVASTVKPVVSNFDLLGFFQGVDNAMNDVVLASAAVFFAISLEDRIKRTRALRDLQNFRSIAHVIDMHQLTKDPSIILAGGPRTAASPERTMTRFELNRYLDYCSEMLSLTSKLAALYAQNLPDPVVIEAVNEIEQLSTNLSHKVWQKITILNTRGIEPVGVPHHIHK
jgi:hypothetical protein